MTVTTDQLLERINTDLFQLHYVWSTFLFLFATDKKTVDVLNAAAPGFIGMTQRLMYDDVILRVNRLTDRAKVAYKDTASLEQLLNLTGWEQSDPTKWKTFSDELKTVTKACKGCRDHRNQRLSHTALVQAKPLPPATRKMVETAINAVDSFVQQFNRELHKTQISFVALNATRDAGQLLRYLTNRRSQKQPIPQTRIVYVKGQRPAELHCGFCGEISVVGYYPDGPTTPQLVSRMHFANCHGLIGCEELTIEAVERDGAEPPRTFSVDLREPLRP